MAFEIIRNDITKVKADAIVNTANPKPLIGSGTDAAIYRAAGEKLLLEARKKIGEIRPGETAYTEAFALDAEYIFHTVGPAWIDGNHGEREILHSCYAKSLALAAELSCESIAFPLMATGSYGFPKDEALRIALEEISRFLLQNDMRIILVVFDKKAFELSGKLVGEIEEFIDENAVSEIREKEYRDRTGKERREGKLLNSARPSFSVGMGVAGEAKMSDAKEEFAKEDFKEYDLTTAIIKEESAAPYGSVCEAGSEKSLEDILKSQEDTFQQRLFRLIDERGLDDVTVYKKANIDRKVFSKIRCKENYKPKKKTAVAFAIALELDLSEMKDLLSRAELAFSPSSKFDMIITFFVTHHNYDIFEINATLFKYGQPILGE